MSKVDPVTIRYFVIDEDGNKQRVFPMKIADKDEVIPLFDKFSDSNVLVNMLTPKIDNGEIARDDNGNIVRDQEAFEAMMAMAEFATKQTRKQLLKWIDVVLLHEILSLYTGISQLQKKQEAMA